MIKDEETPPNNISPKAISKIKKAPMAAAKRNCKYCVINSTTTVTQQLLLFPVGSIN